MYADAYRRVERVEDPTAGGAFAKYRVVIGDGIKTVKAVLGEIEFQPDTIPNVGIKGWTNECLLAVVSDRLTSFQSSEFACPENAIAISAIDAALAALELRTKLRKDRGVEGKHVK